MDLSKILKKVGGRIVESVVPGGSLILDFVNGFFPRGETLSKNATGTDIEKAIQSLSPEQQAELLSKKFEVEIKEIEEYTKVVGLLADADKTGKTTRPLIALVMAGLIVIESLLIFGPVAYAICKKDFTMIKAISGMWPLIMMAIGIPAGVVNSYFGKRSREKRARYTTASGIPSTNNFTGNLVAGIISAIKQ